MSDLGMTWTDAWQTVVTAGTMYVAVIVLSRLFSQRQFSRFTTYDLPFVFALGSLVGRVILVRTTLATALVGLSTMFLLHAGSRWLHHHVAWVHRITENRPVAVVIDGQVVEDNLRRARTSAAELHEQLRLAGVGSVSDVQLAIVERTGAVSVVRMGQRIDDEVFVDVIRHPSRRSPSTE